MILCSFTSFFYSSGCCCTFDKIKRTKILIRRRDDEIGCLVFITSMKLRFSVVSVTMTLSITDKHATTSPEKQCENLNIKSHLRFYSTNNNDSLDLNDASNNSTAHVIGCHYLWHIQFIDCDALFGYWKHWSHHWSTSHWWNHK